MRRSIVAAALLALIGVACAPEEQGPTTGTSSPATATSAADCAEAHSADFVNSGKLTIGTDNPVFQPWFAGTGKYQDWKANPDFGVGNPATGEGYESAAAYDFADRMGFTPDQVDWQAQNFNQSYKPGPKDFDFYIGQVEYTPERAAQVTFSDGYYDVHQALVAKKGSDLAAATTVAEVQSFKLGAQTGTTSLTALNDVVQPTQAPHVYDQSVDVLQAFNNGQIDGYVVDAPTAYVNVLIGEAKNAVVVAQLPGPAGNFGLVLEQGNSLVDCLNLAIGELRADGTLDQLEQKWLADVTYPVLV
jgi:polar amino acid transport system substrate-binding protein